MTLTTRHYTITGKVQGVGFRPFIYRIAHDNGLTGSVRNCTGQVEIHVQGSDTQLSQFNDDLLTKAPAISDPHILTSETISACAYSNFTILPSEQSDNPQIHIPPDFFTCPDCQAELRDPQERRHNYPFINCTQCGPRYTIIEQLPYDRPFTSMAEFPLCNECRKEYENPLDRRFHAQPLACPVCGPDLQFKNDQRAVTTSATALTNCIEALQSGRIVAVKGIGGYHLMCDASSDDAVLRLRSRKPRPDKPLALLVPMRGDDDLDMVRSLVSLTEQEAELLYSPARPILLAVRKENSLSPLIAPGLKEAGIMLPYSPLHHLILDQFNAPLVATSANISGEPVLTDNEEVETRLAHVADAYLHHNRRIVRPADDPVFRTIGGKPRPVRMGRGNAPIEIDLPFALEEPCLAVGSHMKNTIALAWENRLVVSPHIGDLDNLRSQTVFEQVVDDLQRLYQVNATRVISDAHPSYASTHWAEQSGSPVTHIFHHRAHASALVLDHWDDGNWLVFTWDGVGYGEDGTLWGGEALYGRPGYWQRAASMRPFNLPGGEKAGREPWRSAAALCWEAGIDWSELPDTAHLLHQAWYKQINSPQTSAVGRLFDAAAALTGVIQTASFEGQGPMLLEQISSDLAMAEPLAIDKDDNGILRADWSDLLPGLINDHLSPARRAAVFHARLAHTLLAQAQSVRDERGVSNIGLCGGVFQNRKLADYVICLLQDNGFHACMPERLPANDAGICAGQIIEFACAAGE